MLPTGIQAPSFALPDQNGWTHTLEAYRGQKVVLYFYPKDNTPGCTKQALTLIHIFLVFFDTGELLLALAPVRPPFAGRHR